MAFPSSSSSNGYRKVSDYTFDQVYQPKHSQPDADRDSMQQTTSFSSSSVGGYQNTVAYMLDPIYQPKYSQPDAERDDDVEHPREHKAFYGTVPSNTASSVALLAIDRFDINRLPQTDVELVLNKPQNTIFGEISLGQTIKPLISKIGIIRDKMTLNTFGTCTLISANLIMTTRHAIEGQDVRNLEVTFGLLKKNQSMLYSSKRYLDYIIEDDIQCDYAIVRLKTLLEPPSGHVKLNVKDSPLSETALLHYPLGEPLKISVHTFDQPDQETDYLRTFHDSDSCSSGGAYFDQSGRFTAMHLGAQLDGDKVNVSRYAITLEQIVRLNPLSVLNTLASDTVCQTKSAYRLAPTYSLQPHPHGFLIDEEGYRSKKILTELLSPYTNKKDKRHYDKSIELNRGGVALSKPNLAYIKRTYSTEFKEFIARCLKISNLHKVSLQYSVTGYIESDHTIPHDVWKSTKNKKMNRLIKGGGARPGEKVLPAITIPYDLHRNLLTTGSSDAAVAFRKRLVTLCNDKKIPDALILCFKEYQRNKINLNQYKVAIIKSLDEHITLGVITAAEKADICREIFL